MVRHVPYVETPARRAAAARNLAAARAAQVGRPRTAAQHAATLHALAAAHARTTGSHRPQTAAQHAASLRSLAKARAVERTRPRTAAQQAASRRNLVLARAALHRKRVGATAVPHVGGPFRGYDPVLAALRAAAGATAIRY